MTLLASYLMFAVSGPVIWLLAVAFVLAGVGIGCAETAEHAAVAAFAPQEIRGSAFGLLATVQAIGNVAASHHQSPRGIHLFRMADRRLLWNGRTTSRW
ncbi:hypothetical protein AB1484_32985 [Parafrankia sp. FMc6]|uniref:hypothetical protein n=1 Tax=Parafrankia soli TaxID=2599596 RepID=UPI0034D6FD32